MYRLQGIKARLFLQELLQILPEGSKLSLEGELKKQLIPKIPFSTTEEGIFRRNTLAPPQDFWVFDVDKSTLSYIQNELLHQIGIRKHVLHIHIGYEDKLIFVANDNFGEDQVALKPGFGIGEGFLKEMKKKRIIWDYELMS